MAKAKKRQKAREQKSSLKYYFTFLALILIFLLSPQEEYDQWGFRVSEIRQREKILNSSLNYARTIVEATQDQQALEVYNFFAANARMAIPREGGVVIHETDGQIPEHPFEVIALLEADCKQHSAWAELYSLEMVLALFNSQFRFLALRDNTTTQPLWAGLIILHEMNHARNLLDPKVEQLPQTQQGYCLEETRTHKFMARLVNKLAGRGYRELILLKVNEVALWLKEQGFQPGSTIISHTPIPYDSINFEFWNNKSFWAGVEDFIYQIGGPPLSLEDKAARQNLFWIELHFELIQRYYPGSQKDKDAEMACWLCQYFQE